MFSWLRLSEIGLCLGAQLVEAETGAFLPAVAKFVIGKEVFRGSEAIAISVGKSADTIIEVDKSGPNRFHCVDPRVREKGAPRVVADRPTRRPAGSGLGAGSPG